MNSSMAENGQPITQLAFARQGVVTDAMKRVAEREGLDPELIRSEIARGRFIIPANVHHLALSLDPKGVGLVAVTGGRDEIARVVAEGGERCRNGR